MEPITLYEVSWTSADVGDRSLVPHQYSALVIRGPQNMPFFSKLNLFTEEGGHRPFEEVPDLAAYTTHGGSAGSSGSETLLAVYLALRTHASLVKEFFTHKLSLVARKTAKPLTREHLNRLTCKLALHDVNFPSRNAMNEFFANPDNRFMRVRSATTYVPPQGLLKALGTARTHLKYMPGGEGFHEAKASFYEHAKQLNAKKKVASPTKKRKSPSGSVCVGRPRSNCAADPCKWAGPGSKGRQFCRIAKNKKRSRP